MSTNIQTEYAPPPIPRKYEGTIPYRWGEDLIALLPRSNGGRVLDFGCGNGRGKELLNAFGYNWVGIDVGGSGLMVKCDGHQLPFEDGTFDLVVSIAVFEHLYDPFRAAEEIFRVLKPGGVLLGTVAFLEPFHENSYFHMTHNGTNQVLTRAGFQPLRLWPTWPMLESLLGFWTPMEMPLIYRPAAFVARQIARGVLALRTTGLRLVSMLKRRSRAETKRRMEIERLTWTGSVGFLARKEAQPKAAPVANGQRETASVGAIEQT